MTTETDFHVRDEYPAGLADGKEQELSLHLETSKLGNAVVVHCRGRIVYRHEAAALSCKVSDLLEHYKVVVLDLQRVTSIDSAGLGELVALHMWAHGHGAVVRLSGLSSRIHQLLRLTNLTSLLEVFATEDDAAASATNTEVA